VLARLEQIDGVECSFADESGTLIRLSLRPGADPGKVAGAVRRVLSEQAGDYVPVPLDGGAAAAALQREEWRDKSQVAEFAATERGTSARRAPAVLAALLLGCAAVGLGLLWWRHRSRLTGKEKEVGNVGSLRRITTGTKTAEREGKRPVRVRRQASPAPARHPRARSARRG
jgi:hypothetical protein